MIYAKQAYSILGVLGEAVLCKDGSITLAYFIENPEPYSLDAIHLEARHGDWFKALKYMPFDTYVHKQDVFLRKGYDPRKHIFTDTFISLAEAEHFQGKEYLEHYCILGFTISRLDSLDKAYQINPFSYKEALSKRDQERLKEFYDSVDGAVSVLKNSFSTRIFKLSNDDLKYYLFRFVNGFTEDNGLRDIRFEQRLTIGNNIASFFSISDETYLPDTLTNIVVDDTLEVSNSVLQMGFLEKLGVHLKGNHIVNQILHFDGHQKLKGQLENRRKVFGQHKGFSKTIEATHEKLEEFEKEVVRDQVLLCRTHINIMVWDEDLSVLQRLEERVKEVLKLQDIRFYSPSYDGLQNIFLGSVLGREAKLDRSYFFMADLAVSLCLFLNYSTFKDDDEGILFNDRIFQVPLRKDIWDQNKNRIPARNAMVIASTGGGKSSLTLNIVQQYIEQGVKMIIVEFGKSFDQLCKLYPEISAHIDYDGNSALGVNPFYIKDQSELTVEKIKTLTVIVLKYWRSNQVKENPNQINSLTKIIRDYYENVFEGHSFPSFYFYVRSNASVILSRQEIPEEYFDLKSFIHMCSDFIEGGIYENVCKVDSSTEDKIRGNDLIVFELTKIKKDPFLVSIVMSILFDTVENKILSDRSKRGMLVFDEYAETQAMVDVFNGDDIHSTVAFAYQKMRKENGAVMTIIQSPAQLPDNNYTKGIIANTQLLYVLPTTESVYDQVIEAFHIKHEAHISLMKSIKNSFSSARPYSEIFIRFLDTYAIALRLEFSRRKFYAFQTDGSDWQFLHSDYQQTRDLPQSIKNLMVKKNEIPF